jgi:class 3 adenylate cyclase
MGDGPRDLLCVGYGSHFSIDLRDDEPHFRHFERRLASFSRFIRFDPRGIGLSDPIAPGAKLSIEDWVDDALAVLNSAGSTQAALMGCTTGGMTATVAAASYPDRTSALVLVNSRARVAKDHDYPSEFTKEEIDGYIDAMVDTSGAGDGLDDVSLLVPSMSNDPDFRSWWKRTAQRSASPSTARASLAVQFGADVRAVLGSISCPTLVLQRTEVTTNTVGHGQYLADRIPGARLVELPGRDIQPFVGDADAILEEIEEFLTGTRGGSQAERVLVTVLFTDIVGSTLQVSEHGDRAWRELLDRHDKMVGEELRRFRGHAVKSTGDGVLATFDGPARAMRCAKAIEAGARRLGIDLRAGLHTGEVEVRGDDVSGIAVHIAQRVSAVAAPGEVLVSRTVSDLVAGSGIEFADRGEHELKGVPGTWKLFAVAS